MASLKAFGASIDAYPNPAVDRVSLTLKGVTDPNGVLDIIDLSGKKVASYKISQTQTEVSLSGLASGVYIFKYVDQTQSAHIKVMKK